MRVISFPTILGSYPESYEKTPLGVNMSYKVFSMCICLCMYISVRPIISIHIHSPFASCAKLKKISN